MGGEERRYGGSGDKILGVAEAFGRRVWALAWA